MAKEKTIWIDDDGIAHDSKDEAERADMRIKAERVLGGHGCTASHLQPLERINHQTLEPLKAYIDLLVRESEQRTEKYG